MSSSLAYPDFCNDKVRSHFSLFHFSRLCNTLMFEDLYVEVLPTKSHKGSKRSNTIRISIIIVVVIIIFTQFISTVCTYLDMQTSHHILFLYYQEKRSLFPRFYFIGDDDLLEILGQATNPSVIQTHLKKLFAGIHRQVDTLMV